MGREYPERLPLFQGLVEGIYTTKEVAVRLDLSESRVKQIKKSFMEHGEKALMHGNSGRRPANFIEGGRKAHIVSLKRSEAYNEASFAMFRRMLERHHGIDISYTALSKILKGAGIAPEMKRRERHFKRKSAFGERLGIFVCFHDWFGDETSCALHGLVDDATGRITGLRFCRDECAEGYIEVLRQTLASHGVPRELYAEKPCALFGNVGKGDCAPDDESPTLLGLIAVKRLGIDVKGDVGAPYASTRIRHLRNVLRNRLPRWLRRMGFADMERANLELCRYVELFNDRFANEPRTPASSFVPLGDRDLDALVAADWVQ